MEESLIESLCSSTIPLSAKHTHLHNYIKTLHKSPDVIFKFIASFPPSHKNSPFLQKLKLRLAGLFQNLDLVLDLFRHAHRDIVSHVIKFDWLYKSTPSKSAPFENPHFFITEIFPTISHSCRGRVVRKMGKFLCAQNKFDVDSIFEFIQKDFGLQMALPLLPACSFQKILKFLPTFPLNDEQLYRLARKTPQLAFDYLAKYCEQSSDPRPPNSKLYRKTMDFLYDQDPPKFFEFLSLHPISKNLFWSITIGRHRSKTFLKLGSQFIISNFKLIRQKFNLHSTTRIQIWRSMTILQYADLVSQVLPPKIENLDSDQSYWEWLSRTEIPAPILLQISTLAIQKCYKIDDLLDPLFLDYIPFEMVTLLPPEKRLAVAEWKIEKKKLIKPFNSQIFYATSFFDKQLLPQLNWTLVKPIDKAVQELNEFFEKKHHLGHNCRMDHYKCLLLTCWLNQDSKELLLTLKNISQRMRNDKPEVRNHILETLTDLLVDKSSKYKASVTWSFELDHWRIVMDIIRLTAIYEETGGMGATRKLVNQFIHFLQSKSEAGDSNRNDFVETVQLYLKLRTISLAHSDWVIPQKLKTIGDQRLLRSTLEQLESDFPLTEKELPREVMSIVKSIANVIIEMYDQSSSRPKIELPSFLCQEDTWLVARLSQFLKTDDRQKKKLGHKYSYYNSPMYGLTRAKVLKVFFPSSPELFENPATAIGEKLECPHFRALLQMPPADFLNDEFLTQLLDQHLETPVKTPAILKFMRMLRLEGYQLVVDKSADYCVGILKNFDKSLKKLEKNKSSVLLLSFMDDQKFLDVAAHFYPTQLTLDLTKLDSQVEFDLVKVIVRSLSNLHMHGRSSQILKVILKFCVGDFLKLTIGSLYHIILNYNQEEALTFLRSCLTSVKNVSAKKHFLRLFFLIADHQRQREMARELWTNNENCHVTMRTEIFSRIFDLLRVAGTEEMWSLLEETIKSFSEEDGKLLGNQLCSFHGFPPQFLSRFIRICVAPLKVAGMLDKFLGQVESVMESVDESVLIWLVETEMSELDGKNENFYIKFLFCCKTFGGKEEIILNRLNIVNKFLLNLIEKECHSTSFEEWRVLRKGERYSFAYFVPKVCKKGIDILLNCQEEVQQLAGKYVKIIFEQLVNTLGSSVPFKGFKFIFELQLGIILIGEKGILKEDGGSLQNFGRLAGKLVESKVDLYGEKLLGLMSTIFVNFLYVHLPNFLIVDALVSITYGVVNDDDVSLTRQAFAATLFSKCGSPLEKTEKIYKEVWGKIENFKNPAVQIMKWCENN